MQDANFDDPDLTLPALFQHWPEAVPLFFERQMSCPGCPVARFYSLRDVCRRYDLNEGLFRAEIKRRIAAVRGDQ